ncbi:MAG: hypothetical protein V3U51_05520 [Thermoplasmata archaeon]
MYEEESTTSEPGSAPPEAQPAPTYAPAPAESAPPAAPSHGRANAALVAAVIALVIALIGVVMFPGPIGPEGSEGPQGTAGQDGDDGDDGQDGDTGSQGLQGLPGADGADGLVGIACWDLNGNGTGDLPAEDINGDLVVDVNDCTGQDGIDGLDGLDGIDGIDGTNGTNGFSCWDLNQNGIPDLATEDINSDLVVDVNDCTGPMGPPGPGTIMAWNATDVGVAIGPCTELVGLGITITVPSDGFIVIQSNLALMIDHTSNNRDIMLFKISPVQGDCSSDMFTGVEIVANQQPSDLYWPTTTTQRIEPVTAGTYTFYVTAWMTAGASAGDGFYSGSTVAVFYPS